MNVENIGKVQVSRANGRGEIHRSGFNNRSVEYADRTLVRLSLSEMLLGKACAIKDRVVDGGILTFHVLCKSIVMLNEAILGLFDASAYLLAAYMMYTHFFTGCAFVLTHMTVLGTFYQVIDEVIAPVRGYVGIFAQLLPTLYFLSYFSSVELVKEIGAGVVLLYVHHMWCLMLAAEQGYVQIMELDVGVPVNDEFPRALQGRTEDYTDLSCLPAPAV